MRTDKTIEQIKQKLTDYEPDDSTPEWSAIERRIPAAFQKGKKISFWRPAVAAMLVIGLSVWVVSSFFRHSLVEESPVAISPFQEPALQTVPQSDPLALSKQPDFDQAVKEDSNPTSSTSSVHRIASEESVRDAESLAHLIERTPISAVSLQKDNLPAQPMEKSAPQKCTTEINPSTSDSLNLRQEQKYKTLPATEQYDLEIHKKKNEPIFGAGLLASNSNASKDNYQGIRSFSQSLRPRPVQENNGLIGKEAEDQFGNFSHHMPFRFGLTASLRLLPHLTVESGINYTYLRSDFTQLNGIEVDGLQKLYYLGVPLSLNYDILHYSHLLVYAGVAGEANFNIRAKQVYRFDNNETVNNFNDQEPVWAYGLKAGAAYQLISRLELYAEPAFMRYHSNSDLHSAWTDNRWAFSLNVGLRTRF